MRRATSILLAVGLAAAGGMLAFQSRPAASGTFTGAISGGSSGGGTSTPNLAEGHPLYLDHPTDSVYLQYDGGSIGLVGAEVDVPNGFTDSQKVNPDTIITPYAVVSQAASGQAAFRCAQTGCRIYFDVGGNIYAYSDGSSIFFAAGVKVGEVSADTYGSYTDSKVPLMFSHQLFPTGSLGPCDGQSAAGHNPEGTKKVLSASSTSTQSRECLCVSDGAGTPAFTWVNTGCPKTSGTSTTCPACP